MLEFLLELLAGISFEAVIDLATDLLECTTIGNSYVQNRRGIKCLILGSTQDRGSMTRAGSPALVLSRASTKVTLFADGLRNVIP